MAELLGRGYNGRYQRYNSASPRSHPIMAPRNAKYYRHLGKQIRRCLIANPNASIRDITTWCYTKPTTWAMSNVKRHCRVYGIKIDMTDGRKTRWHLRSR